ncbi:MAG: hypothetical protein NZ522_05805, partial [Chitinophagales bacterium]|nr:hypothetical protein [Chitinophagales bacterium]
YGNIPRTDESSNIIGKIQASEYIWYSGTAYHFAKLFAVGGNIKLFYSQLAEFSSVGMAADIGFSINDTAKLLSFSLTATNVGAQFKPYRNGNTEIIPFDLRMGFSFGFKGFPIRFHTTMHNLHRWNIRYSNPRENNTGNLFSSSDAKPSKDIGDEIFRHFILGAEANIKKIVRLQLAYNHLRRQEHRQLNVRSIAGFSFGMGIRIKFMDIQYAFSPYALGRNSSHLTMGIDIQKIPRRKKN